MDFLLTGAEISPMEAQQRFGIMRLGARIFNLREQGVPIADRTQRNGRKHWSVYRLAVPHG